MNGWIELISEPVRMEPLELQIPNLDQAMDMAAVICAAAFVASVLVALSLGLMHIHDLRSKNG